MGGRGREGGREREGERERGRRERREGRWVERRRVEGREEDVRGNAQLK